MFNLQPLTKQILIICSCVLGIASVVGLFYVLATGAVSIDDIVKLLDAWDKISGAE